MNLQSFMGKLAFNSTVKEDFLTDAIEELEQNNKMTDFLAACEQGSKGALANQFSIMHIKMQDGQPLSSVIRGSFSPSNQLLIETGERRSSIVEGLKSAILVNQAQAKLVAICFSKAAYPVYMLIMAFILSGVFGVMVIPNFVQAGISVEKMGSGFSFAYHLWQHIYAHPVLIVVSVILFMTLTIWSMKNWSGTSREWVDKCLPHYIIYKQFQSAYLLVVLSALLRNNRTPSEAVSDIKRFSTPYLDTHLDFFEYNFANGMPISQSLNTGMFPKKFIARLARYERNGRAEELLCKAGAQSFERIAKEVERAMGLVGSLTMLGAIALIGWMASDMSRLSMVMRQSIIN